MVKQDTITLTYSWILAAISLFNSWEHWFIHQLSPNMKIGDKTRRKGRVKQRRQSGHCFDFRAIKSFKQKQMARIKCCTRNQITTPKRECRALSMEWINKKMVDVAVVLVCFGSAENIFPPTIFPRIASCGLLQFATAIVPAKYSVRMVIWWKVWNR